MRKLFLFIAAALVSTGMWAATVTMNSSLGTSTTPLTTSPYIYNNTTAGVVIYSSVAINANWTKTGSPGSGQSDFKPALYNLVNGSSLTSAKGIYSGTSSNPTNYKPQSAKYYTITFTNCTQVKVCGTGGGTAADKQLVFVIKEGSTVIDSAVVSTKKDMSNPETATSSTLSADKTYTLKVCGSGASDSYVLEVAFYYPVCSDPNASIISDQAGYTNTAIDLQYSSDNTSDVVWSIKKNDAETEDASISAGKFTATAAGTYVVTATQAADGTHCAVAAGDATVTLTIANAAEVETVTINSAASTARIEEEVALSMTAENATQYKWYLKKDDGEYAQVATTAGYTFSVEEDGTYNIKCEARNDFNKDSEQNPTWVASSNTHTITVSISSDATLSALSVAGKTLTPAFDPAVTTGYSVGEIGVYELLNVTATATDAPYATYATSDNKTSTVTVTVTAEAGNTQDYTIGYTRAAATPLSSIDGDATWDFTKTGTSEIKLTDSSLPTKSDEFNYADMLTNPDASFNAAALAGQQEYVVRDGKYCQGPMLKFETTVPGTVVVDFSNTGGKDGDRPKRYVAINGVVYTSVGSNTGTKTTSEAITVGSGLVTIEGSFETYVSGTPQYLRVYKVVFTADSGSAIDNTEAGVKAVKVLKNGMLIIEKNGVRYNMLGERVQ